jgi:hypothetical protein
MNGPLLKTFALRAWELQDEAKKFRIELTPTDFMEAFESEINKFLSAQARASDLRRQRLKEKRRAD